MADDFVEFHKALKKFLVEVASHSPVLGIAVAWWKHVLDDPLVAAGLALGYEVLVIFWKGLGKTVWEAVWEGELKPHTTTVLAKWLKASLLHLFSNFRRQYMQQVIYDHRTFSVRGLLTPGQGALEVEQVFVELQIAPSHALQVSINPIEVKDLPGSRPIWDFLRRLKKKDATALAILGPPGCGKTTLLKHLALNFAIGKHRRYRLRAKVPVLLFLRDHATTIVEEFIPLAELAQRYFSDPKRYPELSPPPFWFASQLRAGNCTILLDGLDEVLDAAHRQRIAAWVEQQIRTYPHCQFLLTARPQGYRDNPVAQAYVLEVLPFTHEQVRSFISNWYLAKKLIEHGKDDRGVRQEAERDAQNLLERLGERPHLTDLTVNPLLLTMIANVHNYRATLPEKRVNLYAEICDVFLGHWQEAKGIAATLDARQKRVVLQPLAEAMMMQHRREFSTQETLDVVTPPLLQVGIAEQDISTFMEEITQATSGLLGEQEAGRWSFAHFTFQEYLCAVHWTQTGKAAAWETAQWQQWVTDGWWHETLRLYAAQADANTLVQTCLSFNTPVALQLANEIGQEALTLDPAIRAEIANALQGLVVISLRQEPLTVLPDTFKTVFRLSEDRRPLEYIHNMYEDKGEVVIDHTTGLMWQKSGSEEYMSYRQTQAYLEQLNKETFAGYADWRLPTIPELMSLLEPEKQANKFYINPIFDENQIGCWSADKRSPVSAWVVIFNVGYVDWVNVVRYGSCVRAVRS